MAIGYQAIVDTLISHALATGLFDSVAGHEPASAPGNGLHCAVWAGPVQPIPSSGLASVSVRVEVQMRIYLGTNTEPGDLTDPTIVNAVDKLVTAYATDFTLGGNSRNIDIFGSDGERLRAIPGYVSQDTKVYRIFDIFVPILCNDAWNEGS